MLTKIFYNPKQSVAGIESWSPSAGKPARFVELAMHHGLGDLHEIEPITRQDLSLVHSEEYIRDVFSGRIPNGFELVDERIPQACLWTIGSLLSASRAAMLDPIAPACSPVSGFHHASFDCGGGACTFNGLMVVAAKLLQEKPTLKISVLDLDAHYGNGTADILRRNNRLNMQVMHRTQGLLFEMGSDSKKYQRWLEQRAEEINRFRPDLVIAQLSADAHKDDYLGGLLTSEELRLRDKTVFEGIKAPIAWCLAGGYMGREGESVHEDRTLKIHLATLRAAEASISVRQKLLEPA